jgi:hypothetical protein
VFRLLLGTVVIAAALFAASVPMPSVLLMTGVGAHSATAEPAAPGCTDSEDGRGWNAPRDAAASTSDSTWRWGSLHAALATAADRCTAVVSRTRGAAEPRALAAPAHLRHTPLLI